MMWVAGTVTVISNDPTVRSLGPALWTYGLGATFVTFEEATQNTLEGLLVVDGRSGMKRAMETLRRLGTELARDAIVLADPLEPFVYRTVRNVCQGVVLYEPIDPVELSEVLDTILSRRKAS